MQEPVLEFLLGELGCHIEAGEVLVQKGARLLNVLLLQLAQALGRRVVGQRILADLELRLAVGRQRAEADLVQLLPVDGTVEVATGADGLGQNDTASVQALPDLAQVAAAGNLLNQDRR